LKTRTSTLKTDKMKFLRSKKTIGSQKVADTAAGWIAAFIQKLQGGWAKGMSRLFSKLSPAWAKTVVIGCFLLMTAYSALLFCSAFSKPDKMFEKPAILLKPLPAVKPIGVPPALPDKLQGRIQRFRHYIDSLSASANGRKLRDSLFKKRPGLLDSLRQIENIYCK
jgi:hypothetical protein